MNKSNPEVDALLAIAEALNRVADALNRMGAGTNSQMGAIEGLAVKVNEGLECLGDRIASRFDPLTIHVKTEEEKDAEIRLHAAIFEKESAI